MKSNRNNDEKTIKHLREIIETLKRQNLKLKIENKNMQSLKETIKKLQEEKMDLSRKLIEMEGEAFLYKDFNDINDEMLYNPKKGSKFSTISQKESFLKIRNSSSKEIKKYSMTITSTNFSIIPKNISITVKKITNNSRNSPENYLGVLSKNLSLSINNKDTDKKLVTDSIFDENDSNIILEKNIYKEIENILNEKKNFIIKTLTKENFSFDIIDEKNVKINKINDIEINGNNIEQILKLIRQRKKKVELTKKYLEQKIN